MFTKEEIKQNPEAVLQSIQQTINREGLETTAQAPLPSEEEFQVELETKAVFKNDDPSKFYEIVKKIGYGGFARVFLVKRKDEEGQMCALKFIEPKN